MTLRQPHRARPQNRLLLVAIVALTALALTGIVYALLHGTGNAPSADKPLPPASELTTSQASSTSHTCPPADASTTTELTQAPATTWVVEGNTTYPSSPVYGPAVIDADRYRYCFQQSPEGALFAAANMLTELHTGDDNSAWFTNALSQEIYGRQGIIDAITAQSTPRESEAPALKTIGFTVDNYTPERATVTIAAQVTHDDIAPKHTATFTLVWENNDWKWLVNDTSNALNVTEITNTDGLIDWTP